MQKKVEREKPNWPTGKLISIVSTIQNEEELCIWGFLSFCFPRKIRHSKKFMIYLIKACLAMIRTAIKNSVEKKSMSSFWFFVLFQANKVGQSRLTNRGGFRRGGGGGRRTPPLRDSAPCRQNRDKTVLWESSKNQFGRPKKKKKVVKVFDNFLKIRPPPPRENPRSAPDYKNLFMLNLGLEIVVFLKKNKLKFGNFSAPTC